MFVSSLFLATIIYRYSLLATLLFTAQMKTSSGSVSLKDESELSSTRPGAAVVLPKYFGPPDLLEETGVAMLEMSVAEAGTSVAVVVEVMEMGIDEAAAGEATRPGPGLTTAAIFCLFFISTT